VAQTAWLLAAAVFYAELRRYTVPLLMLLLLLRRVGPSCQPWGARLPQALLCWPALLLGPALRL